MIDSEWHGDPHTITVHSITSAPDTVDDGELEFDLEHAPGCKEELIEADTDHSYLQWDCDVSYFISEYGLADTLRYSGTPITEPGTYRIQGWGTKYWTECGYEYDCGIGVMEPEAGAA